jgi:hypothetical protein
MFGLIYDRVIYLMKIFFSITNVNKQSMVDRIDKYKDSFIVLDS